MPNVPIRATGEAMPSASRRAFLRTTATAGIATAAAAGALALHVTDVAEASPGADPLLDLVQRYEAEERRFENTPHPTDDEADADRQQLDALWRELRDETPRATTEAGALAALRLAHAAMRYSHGGIERPLVGAAMAFYHGRAL